MEVGWYDLAHNQFSQAIRLDPNYYMAYIGKILSNENLGYGMSDVHVGNYRMLLTNISRRADFKLRLTFQEQLLFQALYALHRADSFGQGLQMMKTVFDNDSTTLFNSHLSVIKAYNALELLEEWQPLANIAIDHHNVYALHLLTHKLNPYREETNGTRLAALAAVFAFRRLGVEGAHSIIIDCTDIAEYYGHWFLGKTLLQTFSDFLFSNMGGKSTDLLMVQNDMVTLRGVDVAYIRTSLQHVYLLERFHFYQLQVESL